MADVEAVSASWARTGKDLFSGAAGGIAQVLLGKVHCHCLQHLFILKPCWMESVDHLKSVLCSPVCRDSKLFLGIVIKGEPYFIVITVVASPRSNPFLIHITPLFFPCSCKLPNVY